MEEQEKQEKIVVVDIMQRRVAEHNDLITSVAKMDKVPLKIFELAVSCIDTDSPPSDNIVMLSKKELFNFFDVSDNDKHSRFKKAIEKMQKQAYFQVREYSNKGFEFESIVPIPYIRWNDYDDKVTIRFDQAIMPYLIDLKGNFTQYAISDIMELNNKYSIILYKWFCMNYNQYENYQGQRPQQQLEGFKNPKISVEDLRILTDTVEDYERFQSLDTWVLKKPCEEISKHTHFNVRYDKIRSGRFIKEIQFFIEKKASARLDYKEMQQDPSYLADKSKKEEIRKDMYIEAQQSKYTDMLTKSFMLSLQDVLDMDVMIGMQMNVYPKYDELKVLRGIKGVETHIAYVKSKMLDYSKKNIVKYLSEAISSYLVTVKIQNKEAE